MFRAARADEADLRFPNKVKLAFITSSQAGGGGTGSATGGNGRLGPIQGADSKGSTTFEYTGAAAECVIRIKLHECREVDELKTQK